MLPQVNKNGINNSTKMHSDISKPFIEEKVLMANEHI